MLYRRKLLLSLLQVFGGKLDTLTLQKYLFLLTQRQEEPAYDFLPYKYGCFSFQSYADKRTLEKYNLLVEINDIWIKSNNYSYLKELKIKDRIELFKIKNEFGNLSKRELIRYIYLKYPYFAKNSEILNDNFSKEEIKFILNNQANNNEYLFMSIGYEGKSIDRFFNLLIRNDIKLLCDVRKNAISMKYGFSKNQLKNIANKLNIKYIHIPELGIVSEKRKNLKTLRDYYQLLEEYNKTIILKNYNYLKKLNSIFEKYKRVSIMCFEKNYKCCHRSKVAEAIININNKWKENYLNA